MRETRADNAQGWTFALLLHGFLFALMFIGLWWTRTPPQINAAGSPVSAELTDYSDLSAATRRALARRPEPIKEAPPPPVPESATPPPQPTPEPLPQDSPVPPQQQAQERVPEPSPIEQEKVSRDAIAAEAREREQEEKRRQEQIDLTERKRQEEAEKKQRLAEQQKAEELKKIQAERARAQREIDLAQQKLKQIADARAAQAAAQQGGPPPPGNQGTDMAGYVAAVQNAITSQWVRPDSVPLGQKCVIHITQLPGGDVMSAKVDPSCPYDEAGRRSVEAAVLKAQPLPYKGFEREFQRRLDLNFVADDR